MKIELHVANPSLTNWYKVGSSAFIGRAGGYYFYTKNQCWCYGPFATSVEAEAAYKRYMEGNY